MNTIITNYSNNYKSKHHDEKLIHTIIRKVLVGESIPISGDGKNIRDWLYMFYNTGNAGNVYNKELIFR